MPDSAPIVRLLEVDTHVLPTRTRFPFRYGIAAMTSAPHLILRARFEIDGKRSIGIASEGLPPKWFTKTADTTFEQDLPDMLDVISHAINTAIDAGESKDFFTWWQRLIASQTAWAAERSLPPLLAQLGTSLIERAGLDALCRSLGIPLRSAVEGDRLGLRLETIHRDLDANDRLPVFAGKTVFARHTVGLADPLTDADITDEDRADDGLPQSLEASIDAYGLKYFKIKICGQLDTDLDRLTTLAEILSEKFSPYHYTLDGNEQYRTLADFREHWEVFHEQPALRDFLSNDHLLFVEQPVHRDRALDDDIATDLAAWPDAPKLIIDESDAALDSASRALALGYAGTSHKNCKGVIKGIANSTWFYHGNHDRGLIQSGEDLANLGPIALQQDLAAMQVMGISNVERNGHHYFPGLSAWPGSVQAAALNHHADLYRSHTDPHGNTFPILDIRDGRLDLSSVVDAPFGTGFRIDEVAADLEWTAIDQLTVDDLTIED